jgi:prepilin peptidase CpaA
VACATGTALLKTRAKKIMAEFRAFIELIGMLFTDPRTGVLLLLLAAAAFSDYRTFKIPNLLTGGGILFALAYNAIFPPYPHAGWSWAPIGMLVGFIAMLPMYAMRIMGAGDVKLMAMVGAFLGFPAILDAMLFSVVTAGIAALAFAVRNRVTGRLMANIRELVRGMVWSAVAGNSPVQHTPFQSVGKMAYGVSIAVGTAIYVVAEQLGFV